MKNRIVYFCTCRRGEEETDFSHVKSFRTVQVDDEGICLECGYYALVGNESILQEKRFAYERLQGMALDRDKQEYQHTYEALID